MSVNLDLAELQFQQGFFSAYALGEGQRILESVDERENCGGRGEQQAESCSHGRV